VKRIAIPLFGIVVIMLDGFDLQCIGLIGAALGMGMMASRLFYFAAFAAAIAGLCFFVLGKARQIAA
jgi:hypothetical protein